MKIKHIWSVLCKESVINQDDNTISLHGILEKLSSTLKPINNPKTTDLKKQKKIVFPISYEIVSFWTKELSKEINLNISIKLIDPKGNILEKIINEAKFPKESKRLRTRLKVQGLPVSENGMYLFKVSVKSEKEKKYTIVSEIPLEVQYKIIPDNKNTPPN